MSGQVTCWDWSQSRANISLSWLSTGCVTLSESPLAFCKRGDTSGMAHRYQGTSTLIGCGLFVDIPLGMGVGWTLLKCLS